MKAFWENFWKIVIALLLAYLVISGGVKFNQFVNGGKEIVKGLHK